MVASGKNSDSNKQQRHDIEEYVDYSCSTPLERACRDVETILRSWHICDGSDRHVSFRNTNNNSNVLTPRKKRLSSRLSGMPENTMAGITTTKRNTTTTTTNSSSLQQQNNSNSSVQLIRSATVTLSNPIFSNPSSAKKNKTKKFQLELMLCLWDGPVTATSTAATNTNTPLSLVSNRNSGKMPPDVTSSLSSLFGIGQHLTLTPTANHQKQQQFHCLQSIMELLLSPSLQHGTRNANYYDSFANVTLHATAIQTLAQYLQTILNLATSNAQCIIPAFGIWGHYSPNNNQQITRMNNNNNNNKKTTTNNNHDDDDAVPLMHTIMNVPNWLNHSGLLFQLAADTSPCRVFSENNNNNKSPSITPQKKGNNDDTQESQLGYYNFKVENSNWKGSKKEQNQKCIENVRINPNAMNIPPIFMGYCVGNSNSLQLYPIGASFAVHVVPPGIAFPIHCTTLNSLGQLLLQNCPTNHHPSSTTSPTSSSSNSDYGKVVVSCARHKYHWSKLFEINNNNDKKFLSNQNYSTFNNDPAHLSFTYTYGHTWRKCLWLPSATPTTTTSTTNNSLVMAMYQRNCIHHIFRLLQFASMNANHLQNDNDIVNDIVSVEDDDYNDFLEEFYEPIWGPTDDPLDTIALSVTWDQQQQQQQLYPTTGNKSTNFSSTPLLSLPLRIRSHNTLSSHDVLEMENTLLSNIFNPLYVEQGGGFQLSAWYDGNAACTTLSATNRCLLASTIRAATLDPDTLLGHLTKPSVLLKLHDRESLDDVVCDIMDLGNVGPITRRLVEVLDWAGMADMITNETTISNTSFSSTEDDQQLNNKEDSDNNNSSNSNGWKQRIVRDVLDCKYHGSGFGGPFGFPEPPTEAFVVDTNNNSDSNNRSSPLHRFSKSTPPGRLLSLLISAMSSLRTPAAIAAVWLTFVDELRLRWERRESLANLLPIPGLDDKQHPNNKDDNYIKQDSNTIAVSDDGRNKVAGGVLGHLGSLAALLNASEPDPDRNSCLLHQKLQVFNIGVESILATEAEEFRKHQEQQAELAKQEKEEEEEHAAELLSQQKEGVVSAVDKWCGQSEAPTEVMNNKQTTTTTTSRTSFQPSSMNNEGSYNSNSGSGGLSSEMLKTFNEQQQKDHFYSMDHIEEEEDNDGNSNFYGVDSDSLNNVCVKDDDCMNEDDFRHHQNEQLSSLEGFDIDDDNEMDMNNYNNNDGDNVEVEPIRKIAPTDDSVPAPILLNYDPSPKAAQFDENGRSPSPTYTNSSKDDFLTAIETSTFESCTVGRTSPTNSDFGGTHDNDDSSDINNSAILEEKTAFVMQRQARRGARCPVLGLNLTASGDQLYSPYLLRTLPITDDVILQRRLMVGYDQANSDNDTKNEESRSANLSSRISIAHRLQKPKLMSDMCAFKAANPGSVFQDFINWYGNPGNPLEEYKDHDGISSLNQPTSSIEDASEAIQIMMSIRSFWSDCWDEAEPCPADEQETLYDAMGLVEMLLQDFESMHPAHLMNQVLAVNLAMANFSLREAAHGEVRNVKMVEITLNRLEKKTQEALEKLAKDMTEGTLPGKRKTHMLKHSNGGDNERNIPADLYISPETIAACESVCDHIGDSEIILSRATSLLSKMPGEYELVHQLLARPEGEVFHLKSHDGRSGILNTIRQQQQTNSGREDIGINNLPYPSVREYILQNRDEQSPCQLTVRIGGTHGLEGGGNNSTMGGLVLAMNKCVRE